MAQQHCCLMKTVHKLSVEHPRGWVTLIGLGRIVEFLGKGSSSEEVPE